MIRSLILIVFGGTLLLWSLRSLRAHRLRERYVLLFGAVGLPFMVLAFWPDGVVWLSRSLRIEKATVLVMAISMFTILMLLKLLSIISVQERRIADLAQVVGILMQKQGLNVPAEAGRETSGEEHEQIPGR